MGGHGIEHTFASQGSTVTCHKFSRSCCIPRHHVVKYGVLQQCVSIVMRMTAEQKPDRDRISVPISEPDRKLLKRVQKRLEISEAGLTRMLIRYGLRHLPQALSEAAEEAQKPDNDLPEEGP
jgi:hypothetical protein